MTATRRDPHAGFTLVELTIGLVVIGLMIGSVLIARDMIHNGELKASITDIGRLQLSIRAFQSKYNCLPGDCPNATEFMGVSTHCPVFPIVYPDGTCNGNGDGNYLPWDPATGGEAIYAADQMSKAHLWPAKDASTRGFLLKGLLSDGIFAYIFTNDFYSGDVGINGHFGNTITLGAVSGECENGAEINAWDAQYIDTKMDDGHAGAGAAGGLSGSVAGAPGPGCGPPQVSCTAAGEYDSQNGDAQCRMIIYW